MRQDARNLPRSAISSDHGDRLADGHAGAKLEGRIIVHYAVFVSKDAFDLRGAGKRSVLQRLELGEDVGGRWALPWVVVPRGLHQLRQHRVHVGGNVEPNKSVNSRSTHKQTRRAQHAHTHTRAQHNSIELSKAQYSSTGKHSTAECAPASGYGHLDDGLRGVAGPGRETREELPQEHAERVDVRRLVVRRAL